MASIHEIRIPEMKMEKKAAKSASPNSQDFEVYTDSTMKNRVQGGLSLLNSHNYSGKQIGLYPSTIETNESNGFIHKAIRLTDPDGSMGCVVYSGYIDKSTECAWLLAWHTPIGGSQCKVYVECGRVASYQPDVLDWDIIQQKLEKSSANSSFKDKYTKAEVSAQIEFDDGTANLTSIFNVST